MKPVTKKLFIPIRNSTIARGFTIENFVDDTNKIIQDRGVFILTDGQVLQKRIEAEDVVDHHLEASDLKVAEELTAAELIAGTIKLQDDEIVKPARIEWAEDQERYFGIKEPFQVADDPTDFGDSWALVDTRKPYLEPSERILGLLHGQQDDRAFICEGRHDEVVYTNKGRFICMACGALHCILKDPLESSFNQSLTEQEWFSYVDHDGLRREEDFDIDIVDFLDIEHSPKIWTTFYWEDAVMKFVFYTRATPEELEDHYKHSASIEDLIQAGWNQVPTAPLLAFQLSGSNIEIDKLSNALDSLNQGVLSYGKARNETNFIKHGILHLFHTIELILKGRLEEVDSLALKGKPDNPTVIKLLQQNGVSFGADELQTITKLRKLRNALQHSEAEVSYRLSLRLMRNSIVFIDRFCIQELNVWIAEHIDETAWQLIMFIPEIQENASLITNDVLEKIKSSADHRVSSCPSCKTETVVSEFNSAGICISCRRVPRLTEMAQ